MIKTVKQIKNEKPNERQNLHNAINRAIAYLVRPKDFLELPDNDFIVVYNNHFFISGYDEKAFKFMKGVRVKLESDPDLVCKCYCEIDEFGEEYTDLRISLRKKKK